MAIIYLHIVRTRHDVRVWMGVGIKYKTCGKSANGSHIDVISCRQGNVFTIQMVKERPYAHTCVKNFKSLHLPVPQ